MVSCSNDLIDTLVDSSESADDLSLDDAKKWFNEVYLKDLDLTARKSSSDKTHKRKAAWDRSQKPTNNENKSFIWVPIDYEDESRPGILFYDENTLYKKELAKFFIQPVIEGLIIINKGGKTEAFLGQIAYDPISLAGNNFKLEKSSFTGALLRVDWDDNLINGIKYEKGKILDYYKSSIITDDGKGSRVQECIYSYVSSSYSWGTNSNGEFVTIEKKNYLLSCDSSGAGSFGFGGGGFGGGGACGDAGSWGDGNYPGGPNYYDPLVNSGAGNIQTFYSIYNFNVANAVNTNGPDRQTMKTNLSNAGNAIFSAELAAGTLSWTIDKATALGRSIGLDVAQAFPKTILASKAFGLF